MLIRGKLTYFHFYTFNISTIVEKSLIGLYVFLQASTISLFDLRVPIA